MRKVLLGSCEWPPSRLTRLRRLTRCPRLTRCLRWMRWMRRMSRMHRVYWMRRVRWMRRMRREPGFSLLELMVSMLLLYIVCAYIMGLFSAGQRYNVRNREYSMSTSLARSQMEYLCCSPVESLNGRSEYFSSPYDKYRWSAKVEDFKGNLKLLTLTVTSPRCASSTLQRLRRGHTLLGVTCDEYGDQLVWAQPSGAKPKMMQYSAGGGVQRLSLSVTGVSGGQIGALCGVPGQGLMWGAWSDKTLIGYFCFSGNKQQRSSKLSAPTSTSLSTPQFTGIAGDCWGNYLYCADVANNAIWAVKDAGTSSKPAWFSATPWRASAMPLDEPMGLALDETASILWIAESGACALRPLYLNTGITPSKTSGVSTEGSAETLVGVGCWGPRYRPNKAAGSLTGVAVNPWASAVYTADAKYLHMLIYSVSVSGAYALSWQSYALDANLAAAEPSGMACDPYRNLVYINTLQGQLWCFNYASKKFVRVG